MLHCCKCLHTITDCSVGKHIKPEMQQTYDGIYPRGNLQLSVKYSEKGTCPPQTQCPSNRHCSFYSPVHQKAHGVPLLLTAAAPFNSQPLFQFPRIAKYGGLSQHTPPSAGNRPYPCGSPPLVQCMFYSH